MTPQLRIYLELERLMLAASMRAENGGCYSRDAMDPIWYAFTLHVGNNLFTMNVVEGAATAISLG